MGTAKSTFVSVAVLQLLLALAIAWQFAPRLEVCMHRSMSIWDMLRFVDWQLGAAVLILAAVPFTQSTWVRGVVAVVAVLNFASLLLGTLVPITGELGCAQL